LVIGSVCGAFAQNGSVAAVQGQLFQYNGKPLGYVQLELVPIDSSHYDEGGWRIAATSVSGKFTFFDVPNGKYTLSIKFDDMPTTISPYATYFYPNSTDRRTAEILEIRHGNLIRNLNFKLPPPLVAKKIVGQAIWEDGSPVVGAMIGCRDIAFNKGHMPFGIKFSDKNGKFIVEAFVGRQYQFAGIMFDRPMEYGVPPGNVIGGGETDEFLLSTDTEPITIRMRRAGNWQLIFNRYLGRRDKGRLFEYESL